MAEKGGRLAERLGKPERLVHAPHDPRERVGQVPAAAGHHKKSAARTAATYGAHLLHGSGLAFRGALTPAMAPAVAHGSQARRRRSHRGDAPTNGRTSLPGLMEQPPALGGQRADIGEEHAQAGGVRSHDGDDGVRPAAPEAAEGDFEHRKVADVQETVPAMLDDDAEGPRSARPRGIGRASGDERLPGASEVLPQVAESAPAGASHPSQAYSSHHVACPIFILFLYLSFSMLTIMQRCKQSPHERGEDVPQRGARRRWVRRRSPDDCTLCRGGFLDTP